MKRLRIALVTTLSLALAATLGFGRPAGEREPNDEASRATRVVPLPAGDGRGAGLWGRIAPGDVDFFRVRARKGAVLAVSLQTRDAGEFDDPLIAVFAPGEDEPRAASDDGGPGFLPRLAVPVDRSGRWTVAVTGFGDEAFDGSGHAEEFGYFLALSVLRDVRRVDEWEGRNDDPWTAPLLPHPRGARRFSIVSGRLTPGDVDYFRLPPTRKAFVTASIFDDAGGQFNDSVLRVLGPHGDAVIVDDDGGPGFLSNLALTLSGCEPAVLAVEGFDPDPDDEAGHPESFAYSLVYTTVEASRSSRWPGRGCRSRPGW